MVWIEFEAWMGERAIGGYMDLEDAGDDEPLNFYRWDGFEGGHNIAVTRYPSFNDAEHREWEILVDWFATTDIVQYLVDFADEKKILKFRTESDFGRIFDVELYINCSKLDAVSAPTVEDKDTTIRVKQSTKEKLNEVGQKGQSYDDIVRLGANEVFNKSHMHIINVPMFNGRTQQESYIELRVPKSIRELAIDEIALLDGLKHIMEENGIKEIDDPRD